MMFYLYFSWIWIEQMWTYVFSIQIQAKELEGNLEASRWMTYMDMLHGQVRLLKAYEGLRSHILGCIGNI